MQKQKLAVIVKSKNLIKYTMTITSNKKRYPSKYLQLVQRLQNKSMDIYEFIIDANATDIHTSKEKRLELQTKAIASCDKLSCFIELSLELFLIGSDTASNWQKQVSDIKYMTMAWRTKDKNR